MKSDLESEVDKMKKTMHKPLPNQLTLFPCEKPETCAWCGKSTYDFVRTEEGTICEPCFTYGPQNLLDEKVIHGR